MFVVEVNDVFKPSVQRSLRFIYGSRGEGSVRRYRDEDVEGVSREAGM